MTVLSTIIANAKRHYFEPFVYVHDLLFSMRSACAAFEVDVPEFTEAAQLSPQEFRDRGMSLASQLPVPTLMAMLPDIWAAAHPKHVLVHRIEEARQVANRKRDDRQKRRKQWLVR